VTLGGKETPLHPGCHFEADALEPYVARLVAKGLAKAVAPVAEPEPHVCDCGCSELPRCYEAPELTNQTQNEPEPENEPAPFEDFAVPQPQQGQGKHRRNKQ